MGLKARSGGGGRQGYGQGNRTVRNAKETPSTREQELAAEWFCAAIHEAVLRERLEQHRAATEHQRVAKPDTIRQNRKSVRRGDGDKESFVRKADARGARPSPKKRK